jgi:hypothetical protein
MKKLLIIALLLFSSKAYAQEALQKIRISDFSGGMYSNALPDVIEPKYGASMSNVVLSKPGQLSKRKGQTLFNVDTGSTPHVGVGRFDPDANTSYLVIASGTSVARSQSNGYIWTLANPASPLTSGQNTEFVQANDLLFVLNGFDNTSWYNGSQWFQSTTYPTSPPVATTGAWLNNYLLLGGGTTEKDWLYISNNLDPLTFDADDIIKINTGDGQKIQKIVPFKLNEVVVYKERSVFIVDTTGDPPSICTTNCWTVQPVSNSIGTIAPRSVVNLGNDHWFLSSEPIAIRSLVRSQFDKIFVEMISAPIQDIFDNTGPIAINRTYISKAAATIFGNKYFLAIPTGTSTVNNTVLVYDFITKGWSIISGWYPADWVVFDGRLFYIDATDGRVLECLTGNISDFGIGPSSITSPATPIEFDYITKSIDFDNPENFKELDSIEVEFQPTGSFSAIVSTNLDGGGWASIGSVSLAANSLTLPTTLPSSLGDSGVARKTYQLTSKGSFKKIQIRVNQNEADHQAILQRITVFARVRPWRRE